MTLVTSKNGRRNLRDDRQLTRLLTAVLAPTSNCVDAGANKGLILRKLLRTAPQGQHVAFEPVPALAVALKTGFPTVEVHAVALADEGGDATFYVADSPELSGLRERSWVGTGYQAITVPIRRMDEMIPASRPVSFMKIDVEGAEVPLLRGARRISDHRPLLWIEHGTRAAKAFETTTADLREILNRHGYELWTADGDGPLTPRGMFAARRRPDVDVARSSYWLIGTCNTFLVKADGPALLAPGSPVVDECDLSVPSRAGAKGPRHN